MAKAIAECTCERCGQSFTVSAVKRNRAEAESWNDWAVQHYTVCQECRQKEREQEAAALAAQAKEDGLPELIGSPKQCVWAERLRAAFIAQLDEVISREVKLESRLTCDRAKKQGQAIETLEKTKAYILQNMQRASWWIDTRERDAAHIVRWVYMDHKAEIDSFELEKEVESEQAEAREASRIVPENASKGTAVIEVDEASVCARYPKDEEFRRIAKSAGYTWDGDRRAWVALKSATSEPMADRAADLASRLLLAGFSVCCDDAAVRDMAVSGNFQRHTGRWVSLAASGDFKGWLAITVPRDQDVDLYGAARKIRGSKYSTGRVMVPVASHALVEDFASVYDYKLTNGAKDAIEKYEAEAAVAVAAPVENQADRLAEILKSSDDVIPELRDETAD